MYKSIEKRRTYHLARYYRRRTYALEKLGGKCSECESVDDLEFDHIDPRTKSFTIGKMWAVSEERFEEELSKCQVLCKTCHTEKSLKESGKKRREHGSYTMYRHGKCRCSLCRAANADRVRRSRIKAIIPAL